MSNKIALAIWKHASFVFAGLKSFLREKFENGFNQNG